jgi:integrase
VREALTAHKARCLSTGRDDLVFATAGTKPHNPSNVRTRYLAGALALANEGRDVPLPKLTPHSLRRTFASVLVATGTDPAYVMDQLGHTDAKFTLSVYAKVMRRDEQERERLRALVNAADWGNETALNGTSGGSEPTDGKSVGAAFGSTMHHSGA